MAGAPNTTATVEADFKRKKPFTDTVIYDDHRLRPPAKDHQRRPSTKTTPRSTATSEKPPTKTTTEDHPPKNTPPKPPREAPHRSKTTSEKPPTKTSKEDHRPTKTPTKTTSENANEGLVNSLSVARRFTLHPLQRIKLTIAFRIIIGPNDVSVKPIPVRYSQGPPFPGAAIPSIRYPRITNNNNPPSPKNSSIDTYSS